MIQRIVCVAATWILTISVAHSTTSLNVDVISKSIVAFFRSDSSGNVIKNQLYATGFLVNVPRRDGQGLYLLVVTARHVVDPVWAGCQPDNPTRLYIRVNNTRFVPDKDQIGVSYLPLELTVGGTAAWVKSKDDEIDVAVLKAPQQISSGDYDIKFINFRAFGKPDEIAKLNVGAQTASAGLVPGAEGRTRNNPVFHFGKIAGIPSEMSIFQCATAAKPRPLRVWWLATTLVPGTSGSPIFFDPLFPPGADISAGEPRGMIIGLQSLSVPGAELSGMTPAKYIIDVISGAIGPNADLTLGGQ